MKFHYGSGTGDLRFHFAKTSVLKKCTGCFDKFLKNVVLKFWKKQLTEEEERGKLIKLSQRNDSFEENKNFKKLKKLVDNRLKMW